MDSTIPNIKFDKNGICQFCQIYDELNREYANDDEQFIQQLVNKIKKSAIGRDHDCIVGVSGGTDSSYTLHKAVEYGLKPLAVHFDNGWNAKVAIENIKKLCSELKIDYTTEVMDWEEFKDIQRSFLLASVPDAEIPTDVAIHSTLIKNASKFKLKYVLNGHSFRTEHIMPLHWTYMDGKYVKSIQKKFGTVKLRRFPNFTLFDFINYNIIKGIKVLPFLNYVNYDKEKAKQVLSKTYGWQYSGGHHHESVYTEFFQSYFLPEKFNIDKRKVEYSAMILSSQIERSVALKNLKIRYPYNSDIIPYALKKLDLSKKEFQQILTKPIKNFHDYPTYYPILIRFKFIIKLAASVGLIPKVLYNKFFLS